MFLLQFYADDMRSSGYFVLFSSTRAEGVVKKFGQVLAIWLFVIATFILVAGAYITISELCPMEQVFKAFQPSVAP